MHFYLTRGAVKMVFGSIMNGLLAEKRLLIYENEIY